jgi:hypothetical protein
MDKGALPRRGLALRRRPASPGGGFALSERGLQLTDPRCAAARRLHLQAVAMAGAKTRLERKTATAAAAQLPAALLSAGPQPPTRASPASKTARMLVLESPQGICQHHPTGYGRKGRGACDREQLE